MKITRASDIARSAAAPDYFTGTVEMEPLHKPDGPSGPNALRVHFAPGGRTNWHTHPEGQLLIVVDGEGWTQTAGQAKQVIRPGDVVWIPAGERHWHGATATSAMVHLAMQGSVDGRTADWQEPVADSDYLG
jgi:quercetin dioxygenase-like cupin family protein